MTARPEPLVVVTGDDYEPTDFTARLDTADAGAVVTFTGVCRSEDGRLRALELEHYPGMAERMLDRMARRSIEAHELLGLAVLHRHGEVPVGRPIVTVVAAARHRRAAFDGAAQLMDYLKTDAPFWKKEHASDGTPGEWVAAADRDDEARRRWEP